MLCLKKLENKKRVYRKKKIMFTTEYIKKRLDEIERKD